MVEDVKNGLEWSKELLWEVFEIEYHAPIYARIPGMHSRDRCRRSSSHASVVETAIHLWIKGLT